jgi:hypothetical protein
MMHVIDVVLNSFSDLFRSHRYSSLEKLFSVVLFTAGLSILSIKGDEGRDEEVLQQHELEEVEERRK